MLFSCVAFACYIVLASGSGTSLEALAKTNERLFRIFLDKQDQISGQFRDVQTNVERLGRSVGSCRTQYADVRTALENVGETIEDFCLDVTVVLESFMEQLQQDECANKDVCHEDAICEDLVISFKCTCRPGFQGDGKMCSDVDECRTGAHQCHRNAACTNLRGNYSCACEPGYFGDGYHCTEMRRCHTHQYCPLHSRCERLGSARYCTCEEGYIGNGLICLDIDECLSGHHDCSQLSQCANTNGGYTCTCNAGFQGDGNSCQDVNECLGTNQCHPKATCSNNHGSYSCSCNPGYHGDGYSCEDVDECVSVECQPNSSCHNVPGSYYCECDHGFQGNSSICKDVDECSGVNDCHPNAECHNVEGGYGCSCNSGYIGNGLSCRDICPFTRITGVGCIFINFQNQPWTEAKQSCSERDSKLFSAASPSILAKLRKHLANDSTLEFPHWTGLWVGIQEDTWLGGRKVSPDEWASPYCLVPIGCCGELLSGPSAFGLHKGLCSWSRPSICQWQVKTY